MTGKETGIMRAQSGLILLQMLNTGGERGGGGI